MTIDLKTGSYKGVQFLVDSMPTQGGRRLVTFTYPRSDTQAVEDQGKLPRSFSITATISHDNYYLQRDQLIAALESEGAGVLIHPTFGEVNNVRAGLYDLKENISELGRAKITMSFELDENNGKPQQSANLASQVQSRSNILNGLLSSDLGKAYKATSSFVGNFADAIENLNDTVESITSAATLTAAIAIEPAEEFRASLDRFKANISNLIQEPEILGDTISAIYQSITTLYEDPDDDSADPQDAQRKSLVAFTDLSESGANDPVIIGTTASLIERKKNRDLVRALNRGLSLSYGYLSAVQIDYSTESEVAQVNDSLEGQYIDLRSNQLLSNEALLALDELRVQANLSLNQARANTSRIITIETQRMPLTALVYTYYGSTELVSQIATLNNILESGFVEGEVRILTE